MGSENSCDSGYANDIPQWQKDIIDERLQMINDNPERLQPIEQLFQDLDKEL